MQIQKLPDSQVEIKVSVSADELEKFVEETVRELGKDIDVPGFRPGKAPRKIVEQKVGSQKILAQAAEKAVKKSYVDSIVKNKIEAVGEPKITITKIASGNDLEYKALVSVMPKITLGNYRKQIESVEKKEPEDIKPEDVQKEIESLQKSRAKLVTISREAKKGDRVEIDFEVLAEGKTIEGGKSLNHPLTIGEKFFIPGFEENLIGMKANDTKEFELIFPKDYHRKELAEKPARFTVKVNLVQEKILPDLDDEFAKSLGQFENLESLKSSIKEGLREERKKRNAEKRRNDIIEKIISEVRVEIPQILMEAELDKMMSEFEGNISSMGMNLDQYLENIQKKREQVRNSWKNTARKRVLAALALQEIAREENITVESSEIEKEMNKTLAHFKSQGDIKKNLDMEKLYDYVKGVLTNEKVFQLLESL